MKRKKRTCLRYFRIGVNSHKLFEQADGHFVWEIYDLETDELESSEYFETYSACLADLYYLALTLNCEIEDIS